MPLPAAEQPDHPRHDRPGHDLPRRDLLAASDELLDQVERLRLDARATCPPALADAVQALQDRLGRAGASRPRTVRAAQQLVFAVQARLMAANPHNIQPQAQPGRPAGVARVGILGRGVRWKFLALPPPPAGDDDASIAGWRELVALTVERALDRWCCAQDQAVNAARARDGSAAAAVGRAAAAWRNYWDLRCEAEELLARSRPPAPDAIRLVLGDRWLGPVVDRPSDDAAPQRRTATRRRRRRTPPPLSPEEAAAPGAPPP